MKALALIWTWGRTIHTMNFAPSLDCSIPVWVLRKGFSWSISKARLFVYSDLHRSPLSLHMPGKICLAKHAQLLCLPVTGFTQPVLWVTRPGEQGCLSAAQPHPSSKCKTERCYKEQFCCAWNCKQASTAHPLSQHTSIKACSS